MASTLQQPRRSYITRDDADHRRGASLDNHHFGRRACEHLLGLTDVSGKIAFCSCGRYGGERSVACFLFIVTPHRLTHLPRLKIECQSAHRAFGLSQNPITFIFIVSHITSLIFQRYNPGEDR